jgi:hypothetical protein
LVPFLGPDVRRIAFKARPNDLLTAGEIVCGGTKARYSVFAPRHGRLLTVQSAGTMQSGSLFAMRYPLDSPAVNPFADLDRLLGDCQQRQLEAARKAEQDAERARRKADSFWARLLRAIHRWIGSLQKGPKAGPAKYKKREGLLNSLSAWNRRETAKFSKWYAGLSRPQKIGVQILGAAIALLWAITFIDVMRH